MGVAVLVFFMGLNALFARALGWGAQAAFFASYPPALALHFTLNKVWTFGDSRATSARHIGDYLFSVVATFLIQWPAFTALHGAFHLPGWLAAGGANAIQMAASYVLLKKRVFGVEQPGRVPDGASSWHRLALLLAIAGVSALFAWTSLGKWELPQVGPRQMDYFNYLVSGFQKGSLALDIEVADALKASKNPYDPAMRSPGSAPHDVSYYKGRFYLYFGVVPVVLLFWPFRALTGCDLSMTCAAVIYGVGAFWLVAWLWLRVVRDHFPRASLATKLGGLVAVGLAGGQLALVRRTSFWEIPIAGGYFHMACLAGAAYMALRSERRWPWLAAAGLSLGLAVGCRPTLIAAGGAMALLVAVIGRRKIPLGMGGGRIRRSIAAGLAAGIPLAAVLAALFAYNAARFGNPLEFGLNYQLTAGGYESKVRHFSLTFAPFNFREYFWAPPQWGRYFPFLHPVRYAVTPRDYYGVEYVYGALVVCPLIWFCALFPVLLRRRAMGGVAAFAWLLFAVAAGTTGLLLCFNTAAARYVVDFLPWWVWLGVIAWAALERELLGGGFRRTASVLGAGFAGCAAFSCAVGFFESADVHGILRFENPSAYTRISRWFDTPAAIWERMTRQSMGALEMDVKFPERVDGSYAPLVVSGVEYQADYVYVHFISPGVVRLAHVASGGEPLTSDDIPVEPGRSYHLSIAEGSLFPPEGHPIYDGWTAFEVREVKNWVAISVDGVPVLDRAGPSHDASPGSIQIGADRGSGIFGTSFGGVITNVRRDELSKPESAAGGVGDVILELTFPTAPETQIQPLIALGRTGLADLIGLRMVDPDHFDLVYESWGSGLEEGGPFAVPKSGSAVLRLHMGAMYRGGGGPLAGVLGDWVLASLDGAPIWWVRSRGDIGANPPLEIATNSIGSSAMVPFFEGRIRGWHRGPAADAWHPGAFGALEMDLVGRGAGSEPLVATGPTGGADTLAVEWLADGKARLIYDHWGYSAAFSPAFEWGADRIHTIHIELPSFPRLDSGAASGPATGRLQATFDGATVWDTSVQFNQVRSGTLAVGRNTAGSSMAAPGLSCAVADVRQVDQGAPPARK